MDMDLHQQIEHLQEANTLLFGAVLFLVCGWLAEDRVRELLSKRDGAKEPEPTCPLHKLPRNQCARYHKDEE